MHFHSSCCVHLVTSYLPHYIPPLNTEVAADNIKSGISINNSYFDDYFLVYNISFSLVVTHDTEVILTAMLFKTWNLNKITNQRRCQLSILLKYAADYFWEIFNLLYYRLNC